MIPRYSRKEMADIWSDESRFEIWLEVETLALEQMVEEGLAPKEAYQAVKEKGAFDTKRVLEIESEVKHDVIAFLTNVAENVGPLSRFVHRGMTSSDLLDTTYAVQMRRSGQMILKDLEAVAEAVKEQAEKYKYTPCVGRSHGIHAEPITFGLKLISWYAELMRHKERLERAVEEISYGKISGAVGTYASVSPQVEAHVMKKLGLKPESVSTQIVPRDRHAVFFSALALLGSSLERFCVEIRHLQRTEVGEVEEPFGKGQKGSSAMPHKKNPILTENMTGQARLLRSFALSAMENVPLWHERDISHSSVERVIGPDSCVLTDFVLHRFLSVIKGLVVHEERMQKNLDMTAGIVYSGTLLIAMVDSGITREDAYRLVQKHALAAWEGGANLEERIRTDKEITERIDKSTLDEVFSMKRHTENVDFIFQRVLGGDNGARK